MAGIHDLASLKDEIQQYWILIKLVMVVTCFILMAHSVEYNDFEQNG
jgi:hypothetical protein